MLHAVFCALFMYKILNCGTAQYYYYYYYA